MIWFVVAALITFGTGVGWLLALRHLVPKVPPQTENPDLPPHGVNCRCTAAPVVEYELTKPHLVKTCGHWWVGVSRNNLAGRPSSYVDDICAAHQWCELRNRAERYKREALAENSRQIELREVTWSSK